MQCPLCKIALSVIEQINWIVLDHLVERHSELVWKDPKSNNYRCICGARHKEHNMIQHLSSQDNLLDHWAVARLMHGEVDRGALPKRKLIKPKPRKYLKFGEADRRSG